ncbi:MAG: hypothetical protein WD768_20450 [Phycisphaeraceae bacterium]
MIVIDLNEEQLKAVRDRAKQFNMTMEEYACLAIREYLKSDVDFDRIADRVIERNSELYRRLADE